MGGHVVPTGEGRDMYRGNLREGDHWGDPSVNDRIILKGSSGIVMGGCYGLDRAGSG